MSSLTLNTEDIKASLKDIANLIGYLSYIFLIPIPIAIYWVMVREYGIMGAEPPELLGFVFSSQVGKIFDIFLKIVFECFIFIIPAAIASFVSSTFRSIRTGVIPKPKHLMLSVALAGLIIPLIGTLPFILSGTLSPLDSWFESVSGWSATGLTMMKNPDGVGKDILFYRSITHWFGGLGIIAMALVVFMKKGTVASTYYGADKGETRIKPSIRGTIGDTWKIYVVYTIACIILLYLTGVGLFDAVNHAMSIVSTGSFSTHREGIDFFADKPLVQLVVMVFMIIGSISMLIHIKIFEGRLGNIIHNIEFRYLVVLLLLSTLLIAGSLYLDSSFTNQLAPAQAAFQTISALSTSGFSTVDLNQWPDKAQLILIFLMFIGGLYGSPAGGIKILRLVVVAETIAYSMKKVILPKTAILRVKIGGAPIEGPELLNALGLSAAFLLIAFIGMILLLFNGLSMTESVFMTAASISNTGLTNMPTGQWFAISDTTKIILTILMWAGRIEILPAMILASSFISGRNYA